MLVLAKTLAAGLLGASALRRQRRTAVEGQDCYSAYDGMSLVQLFPSSEAEVNVMNDMIDEHCMSLVDDYKKVLMAICDNSAVTSLTDTFVGKTKVLLSDAGAFYRKDSGTAKSMAVSGARDEMSSTFYQTWQDYDTRMARVSEFVSGSGGIANLETVGYSVENRPIFGVRFTGQGWQSGMTRVILDFQLHAREWIVGMAGVYAVEMIIQKAQEDPSWLSGMEIVVVPTVNPDGTLYSESSERFWRKNMRVNSGSSCLGVDLNRNFNPMWSVNESSDRCSDTYYGSAAFSEPEAQAIKNLVDEAQVTLHLDVHSYSEVILAPWAYSYDPHPNRAQIDVPGQAMTSAINAKYGKNYRYGGSEILYTAAGVCPDYSTSQGGFGYTYELRPGRYGGGGFAPPASEIAPTVEETWAGIEAGINWAKDPTATPSPTPSPPPPPPPTGPCYSFCQAAYCQYTQYCGGCSYC